MPPLHDTTMKRESFVSFGGITFSTGDYVYADQDCVIVLNKPDHE
jgi:regulator of RNase E activity RraA